MTTFLNYLIEARYDRETEKKNFNISNFRHNHSSNGYTIKPSIHAASQAYLHRPEFTHKDWEELHSKVMSYIDKNPDKVLSGKHIFYSRVKQQGYFSHVEPENKHIDVVTVLEKGKSRTTDADTRKHMVESASEYNIHYVD